jgi:hypothetical protein
LTTRWKRPEPQGTPQTATLHVTDSNNAGLFNAGPFTDTGGAGRRKTAAEALAD